MIVLHKKKIIIIVIKFLPLSSTVSIKILLSNDYLLVAS